MLEKKPFFAPKGNPLRFPQLNKKNTELMCFFLILPRIGLQN
jgi:hypothetical protein